MMYLKIVNESYKDQSSIRNLIDYVGRDKTYTDSNVHNTYTGGVNISNLNNVAEEFIIVKNYYGSTDGRQVRHMILSPDPKDLFTAPMLYELALYVCAYYGNRYQVFFSVHTDKRTHLHVHFVMNTVSFVDGKKLHDTFKEQSEFRKYCEDCYAQIKRKYLWAEKQTKSI